MSQNDYPNAGAYPSYPVEPQPGTAYPPSETNYPSYPGEPQPGYTYPPAGTSYPAYPGAAVPADPPGNYGVAVSADPPGNYGVNPYGQQPVPYNNTDYPSYNPNPQPVVLYDTNAVAAGGPNPAAATGPPTDSSGMPVKPDDNSGWNAEPGKEEDRRVFRCGGGMDGGPVRGLAVLGVCFLVVGVFALIATILLYTSKSPYSGPAVLLLIGAVLYLVYGLFLTFATLCGCVDCYNSRYKDQRRCNFLMGQLTFLVATALMGLGIASAGLSAGQQGYVKAVFKMYFEDFANSTRYPPLETAAQVKRVTESAFNTGKILGLVLLILSILVCSIAVGASIYFHRDIWWGVWNFTMIPAVLYSVCGIWTGIALFAIHVRAPSLYDAELLGGIATFLVASIIALVAVVGINIFMTFWAEQKMARIGLLIGWAVGFVVVSVVGFVFQIYIPTNVKVPKNECTSCLDQDFFYTCNSNVPSLALIPGVSLSSSPSSSSSSASASSSAAQHAGLPPPLPPPSPHTLPGEAGDTDAEGAAVGRNVSRGVGKADAGNGDGVLRLSNEGSTCTDNKDCTKLLDSLALYNSVMNVLPVDENRCFNFTETLQGWFSEVKHGVYDLKIAAIWVCIAAVIPSLIVLFILTCVGCLCCLIACARNQGHYHHGRHYGHHHW